MNKPYPARTTMLVRDLEKETDPFMPKEEGEVMLESEYPYLSDICVLIYLANNTISDIVFTVNYLARQCSFYNA
jgi:hypothetical protein